MSKAFTREDADASFATPAASDRHSGQRMTAYGARILRERLVQLERGCTQRDRLCRLLAGAVVVDPAGADHVALGARVQMRSSNGAQRTVVIVTPDEVGLVPLAISAASPLAQALLGAREGDVVELDSPRGAEELTIVTLEWPV